MEKTLIKQLQEQLNIKKHVAKEMAARPWGEADRHYAAGMLSVINDIEKILRESGQAAPKTEFNNRGGINLPTPKRRPSSVI